MKREGENYFGFRAMMRIFLRYTGLLALALVGLFAGAVATDLYVGVPLDFSFLMRVSPAVYFLMIGYALLSGVVVAIFYQSVQWLVDWLLTQIK